MSATFDRSAMEHTLAASSKPRFVSIETWCTIAGISRRQTYDRIAEGKLRAVKDGTKTLIDMESGERYLAARPEARVTRSRCKPVPAQPAVTLASLGLE